MKFVEVVLLFAIAIGVILGFGQRKKLIVPEKIVPEKTTIAVFVVQDNRTGSFRFGSGELRHPTLKDFSYFQRKTSEMDSNATITIINLIEVEK